MPDDDLDALIAGAITCAEMAIHSVRWAVAGSDSGRLATVAAGSLSLGEVHGHRAPRWTPDEDAFLTQNLGILSEDEIAQELGRTRTGVQIHWKRDLGLPGPSCDPEWLTILGVANLLHVDQHAVAQWRRRGILDGFLPLPWLNQGLHPTYRIRRLRVLRFAVNPANWIYFKPERVREPHLRRLLDLQRARWHDEWWTTGQVGDYHGVVHTLVEKHILAGKIPAVRWNNWRVLRSVATAPATFFMAGKGSGHERDWSPDGDAFMVLAKAVGLSLAAIDRMMHLAPHTVSFRLTTLQRTGQVPVIIAANFPGVCYQPATGALLADWRDHPGRFPALELAIAGFLANRPLTLSQQYTVRGVLAAWARYYGDPADPRHARLVRSLTYGGRGILARLTQAHAVLLSWGLDPLGNRVPHRAM